jgi:DNA-binding NarL/FixJ family response regulator
MIIKKQSQKQEAMQWSRDKVLEYTSQGYTQREIAATLQVANSKWSS